jgi:hypothetical protein
VATPQATTPAPAVLTLTVTENPFRCDGQFRVFGHLGGALPGETITYSASPPATVSNGTADSNGERSIVWQCNPGETGPQTLAARGATSGRTGSVTFQVVSPSP